MMKGFVSTEESMSNLTCASGEVSASSCSRIESDNNLYSQHQTSFPPKKKRNLPGNPDPKAEVIALSPRTLLATNRFVCEICKKGFQRDQNLQLHRRGHNLPWKLKQKTNKEERKRVYVCPETTCVHHDPSRALGDLTGIKKHFSRKHGEKKWKCEKCSKKYAVQSDWKAHSKICGTREYRCDCGKVFSRRDSFITHRAFCDVLAEESARAITGIKNHHSLFLSSSSSQQFAPSTSHHHILSSSSLKNEQQNNQLLLHPHQNIFNSTPNINVPTWLISSQPDHHHLHHNPFPLLQNPNPNSNSNPLMSSPHLSATALLQKAAQMGVTMSKTTSSELSVIRPHHQQVEAIHMSENNNSAAAGLICSRAGSGLVLSSREEMSSGFGSFGNKAAGFIEQFSTATPSLVHDMIMTRPPPHPPHALQTCHENRIYTRSSEGLTRDFLGLKAFPDDQRDQFIDITGLSYLNPSFGDQQNQNQTTFDM